MNIFFVIRFIFRVIINGREFSEVEGKLKKEVKNVVVKMVVEIFRENKVSNCFFLLVKGNL